MMSIVFRVTDREARLAAQNAAIANQPPADYEVGTTDEWFKKAVPLPTAKSFHVQLGVHFEEVREMADAVKTISHPSVWQAILASVKWALLKWSLRLVADGLKGGTIHTSYIDADELLDSVCDQRVTATGVGYMADFQMQGATAEVDRSNFSKFENGEAVFTEQGKIAKGKNFSKPNLLQFIPYATKVLD